MSGQASRGRRVLLIEDDPTLGPAMLQRLRLEGFDPRLVWHRWPGNIRELRNRIERAVALRESEILSAADLFPDLNLDESAVAAHASRQENTLIENALIANALLPAVPLGSASSLEAAADAAIRRRVRETLKATGGNQSQAARLLGVSRTTIWKYARDGGASADD